MVVDVGAERREVATGARGDPAAERRVLERLRVVAQRQAVLAQLLLEPRPGGARLNASRLRDRVHVEHAVEPLEVDRDDAREAVADGRLDATHDARPASERDRRRAALLAPVEHGLELSLVPRVSDHVGKMVEAAAEGPHDVAVGLAVGVRGALVRVAAADPRKAAGGSIRGAGRSRSSSRTGDSTSTRREAQMPARRARRLLDLCGRRLLVLEPPAPELEAPLAHRRHGTGGRPLPGAHRHHRSARISGS